MHDNKLPYFNSLKNSIKECDLCQRLCNRNKVFSEYNGNINAKVLFIAEAPGRLGADKTTVPLYGDRTGENFDSLLKNINWSRDDIFITNSILCNPRTLDGNNDKPTIDEIKNCNVYLEMTINLITPELVVTLGTSALNALKYISYHNYILKECVSKVVSWNNMKLMPLYHPGPRAILHRNMLKQRSDFISLSNIINPKSGFKNKKRVEKTQTPIYDGLSFLVLLILENYKSISYFKLTKLLYLIDLNFIMKKRQSITNSIYIRQKDGPWPPSLNTRIKSMLDSGIISKKYVSKYLTIFYSGTIQLPNNINENDKKDIMEILNKYKDFDNSSIKIAAYRTEPMRFILEQEKKGMSYLNKPVIFNNRTVKDIDKTSDNAK
jgi:uracil-DNA glycosylase family 4